MFSRSKKPVSILTVSMILLILFSVVAPVFAAGAAQGTSPVGGTTTTTIPPAGPFGQVIAGLINDVAYAIEYAGNALGFTNMNQMIFNQGLSATDLNYAPFSGEANEAQMWNDAWTWYVGVAAGVSVLLLILVLVTAFKFIASPFNKQIKEDAVESLWRWILAILIVAAAPLLYDILLSINNGLVDLFLGVAQTVRPGADLMSYFNAGANINTGNVIYDAVVTLAFQGVRLWLGVLFTMRQLVLLVIFIFTPLMAIMWAINKKINAAGIWLGEIVSNVFMQCSYAFVFLILITFVTVTPQAGTSSAAASTAGTAATLNTAVTDIINNVGAPIGGAILLVSVCWVAIQIVLSRFSSQKKESVYGNLFYVGIGGVILGSILFFASFVYNIATEYFGYAFNTTTSQASGSAPTTATSQNMIVILIWFVAMLPIAEMIRNSMLGLFTRHSEFDEAGFATKSLAAIAGLGGLVGLSQLGKASFGAGAAGGIPGGAVGRSGGMGGGGVVSTSGTGSGGANPIALQGREAFPGGDAGSALPATASTDGAAMSAATAAGGTVAQGMGKPGAGLIGGLQQAASFGERAGARVGGAAGAITSSFVSGATALAGSAIPGGKHLADAGQKFGHVVGKVAEHGVGAVTRGIATYGHLVAQTGSDWLKQGDKEGYGIGESFRRVTGGETLGDASGRAWKVAGANTVDPYFAGKALVKMKPSLDGYRPNNG